MGFIYPAALVFAHGTGDDECEGRGVVYIAHTVDAEAEPASIYAYAVSLNLSAFKPGQLVDLVTSGHGRNNLLDSYEGTAVYTWFLLSDEFYCVSTGGDCAAVHTAMEPYFDQARSWGDIFGWHYHNLDWSDLNGDGIWYWNQLLTFNGTRYGHGTDIELAEKSLAYLIIEKGFYPSVFRSGWGWENNDFSTWLDNIVPFDFSNFSPLKFPQKQSDGISNVYDWSRAPVGWSYYHPAAHDYQVPGDSKRYLFRTSNNLYDFAGAFAAADSGTDQLIVTYTHSYNGGEGLDYSWLLQEIRDHYPCVPFRFINALDGARAILGLTDTAQPMITVDREENRFFISSDKPLFTFPYGALRTGDDRYMRIYPTDLRPDTGAGQYVWVFDLEPYCGETAPLVFAIAGTTKAGATFVSDAYDIDEFYFTHVDESSGPIPEKSSLSQNAPNPFNGETRIQYTLSKTSNVTLTVYSILGQLVKSLVNEELPAGDHTAIWDGTDRQGESVASGTYIYRLEAGEFSSSRKLIFLK